VACRPWGPQAPIQGSLKFAVSDAAGQKPTVEEVPPADRVLIVDSNSAKESHHPRCKTFNTVENAIRAIVSLMANEGAREDHGHRGL
jgi:hypothetical protein